jgi:hypothetical protein
MYIQIQILLHIHIHTNFHHFGLQSGCDINYMLILETIDWPAQIYMHIYVYTHISELDTLFQTYIYINVHILIHIHIRTDSHHFCLLFGCEINCTYMYM